jgi:hypothetical protein
VNDNTVTSNKSLDLNFSIQNVRSLNIATKNLITDQKLLAITKLGSDIIFLADLRLNSLKQITACKEIVKSLYILGYKFIFNSPVANRGVGFRFSINFQFTTQLGTRMVIIYFWTSSIRS